MKKLLAVSFLVFAAVLNSFPASTNQPPTSAEQLRSELEAALRAEDTNAVLALYNWKNVSNGFTSSLFQPRFDCLVGYVPKNPTNAVNISVKLEPWPDYFGELDVVWRGYHDKPNVSILGNMNATVNFEENGTNFGTGLSVPYGEKNGAFYLANIVVEPIWDPISNQKNFEIAVTKKNPSLPARYIVAYTYVQNGREASKSFDINNNAEWHREINCDELKSCSLQRVSGENDVFKLKILDKTFHYLIFVSATTNNPISYENERKN